MTSGLEVRAKGTSGTLIADVGTADRETGKVAGYDSSPPGDRPFLSRDA
ncbi:UNVERIFIED_CONTAM: hypothetical protein RKD43_001933 [Streptomyces graminofaciens]